MNCACITDPHHLHAALIAGLKSWTAARGELILPARRDDLDAYHQRLDTLFASLERPFDGGDRDRFRQFLDRKLERAERTLTQGMLVLRYGAAPPQLGRFACRISGREANADDGTISARGELALPCAPALYDYYGDKIETLLTSLGQRLSQSDRAKIQTKLQTELQRGYDASPYSQLIWSYRVGDRGFKLKIVARIRSLADQCQHLINTVKTPLFGRHPDAKVMDLARSLGAPETSPVLDAGAGTGRNALPLARLGHPVDALELAPAFVERLQVCAREERLPLRPIAGDVLDPHVPLKPAAYDLVVLSEVVPHFESTTQLRSLLVRMADIVRPGGRLLFSLFLAVEGYQCDRLAREMARLTDSFIFSREELAQALDGLPFEVRSDESVCDYERDRLPSEAWPPTDWFEWWATGQRLFALSQGTPPIELRWIACDRRS